LQLQRAAGDLKYPALQIEHEAFDASGEQLDGQESHRDDAAGDIWVAEHCVQCDEPADGANVPGGHSAHRVSLLLLLK
jgi:hypothetical protein